MREIVLRIFKYGLIKFGEFKLASGITSPFYIDLRRMYSYPQLSSMVIEELASRINLNEIDAIVGVATAGVPLAAMLSYRLGIPMGYVRVERKDHGLNNLVEGEVSGLRVLVVDDVATTGLTIIKAVKNLLDKGAKPVKALVVIDREQGASENLSKHGVELVALLRISDVFRVLREEGFLDEENYIKLLDYISRTKISA